MEKIINSFYNIKYKVKNLDDAIHKKGDADKYKDELYDVNIAIQYINQMIKNYNLQKVREEIIKNNK